MSMSGGADADSAQRCVVYASEREKRRPWAVRRISPARNVIGNPFRRRGPRVVWVARGAWGRSVQRDEWRGTFVNVVEQLEPCRIKGTVRLAVGEGRERDRNLGESELELAPRLEALLARPLRLRHRVAVRSFRHRGQPVRQCEWV